MTATVSLKLSVSPPPSDPDPAQVQTWLDEQIETGTALVEAALRDPEDWPQHLEVLAFFFTRVYWTWLGQYDLTDEQRDSMAAGYLPQTRARLAQAGTQVQVKGLTAATWAELMTADPDALLAPAGPTSEQTAAQAAAAAHNEVLASYAQSDWDGANALPEHKRPRLKMWLSAHDNRVRPSHVQADGQVVPFDQPFMVGGWPMMYPHDVNGPIEETANCRCVRIDYYGGDEMPPGFEAPPEAPDPGSGGPSSTSDPRFQAWVDQTEADVRASGHQDVYEGFTEKDWYHSALQRDAREDGGTDEARALDAMIQRKMPFDMRIVREMSPADVRDEWRGTHLDSLKGEKFVNRGYTVGVPHDIARSQEAVRMVLDVPQGTNALFDRKTGRLILSRDQHYIVTSVEHPSLGENVVHARVVEARGGPYDLPRGRAFADQTAGDASRKLKDAWYEAWSGQREILSRSERNAVDHYGTSFYKEMNGQLRAKRRLSVETENLLEAFKKGPTIPKEVKILFRATRDDGGLARGLKVGDVFSDDGVISTSMSPNVSAGFSWDLRKAERATQDSVFYRIRLSDANYDARVLMVNEFEDEIALPPGSMFKVARIQQVRSESGAIARIMDLEWV